MPGTLVVPIDVAALAVGDADVQHGATHLAPMADFSRLPPEQMGPYTSAAALANATPFHGGIALPRGVHLHWALPDGLTAGAAGADGLAFPAVPNRWLVARVVVTAAQGTPATTALRAWVVESDRQGEAATAPPRLEQPTVPLPVRGAARNYDYLGQAFDLAGWSETEADRLEPLTVVGYGEPAFAAFYPNCSTVFGHYDPLDDLGDGFDPAAGTLTYLVAGWYADPAADPLARPGATPADFGWSAPPGASPTATVCAGVVDALPWDPAGRYLDAPPREMTAALGPSTPEALSALMAQVLQQPGSPAGFANAEQVLNALQFGLLSGSTHEVDSLAAFEEDVHAAGFGALSSGPLWTVTEASAGTDDGGEVTLPDTLGDALNALNVKQLALNDAGFRLQAMRFQLFVDWYKYQIVEHAPALVQPPLPPPDPADAVRYYLDIEVDAIAAAEVALGALRAEVDGLAAALAAALPAGLALNGQTGAPRYYQPADPVLVLSGPDVTPTPRYGGDGAGSPDGMLPCRTEDQVVSAVTLAAGVVPGSAEATLAAAALPQLPAQPTSAPAALLQALLAEAFFLCAGLQPAVAAALALQGGAANPALLDPAATVAALRAAGAAFLAGAPPAGVSFTGTAPAAPWYDGWTGTPWLPFLLQYSVQLAPVEYLDPAAAAAAYPPDFIDGRFAFGADDVDLAYTGPAPAREQPYEGSIILTPGAVVDLAQEISAFLAGAGPDPELKAVLDALAGLPLLAQGLTGATQAMLMRAATLQMPVADPLAPPPLQQGWVKGIAAAVGGENRAAPLPQNSFNPIRAGTLRVQALRLVDVFGRFLDYGTPTVVVAASLAPPPRLSLPAGTAFLPPRLTQPARLQFRWRSAADRQVETNASPATSPVLGWVVPNELDRSLLLYAPDGTALGGLALAAGDAGVLWTPAPGGAHPIGTPLDTVLQGQNADLADFARGVYNGGDASFFAPFFAALREALAFSLPARFAESAGQAVLAGQPLALARASLALELAGPAAQDQSWTSFAARLIGEPPDDAGVGAVRFPVLLGAPGKLGDTLVGYWIAPSSPAEYRVFQAPYATAQGGGVTVPRQDTLTLTPAGEGTDVVILLDPRGMVNATTGVLPVKTIDIPPEQYADALAGLRLTFETTPVLSGSNAPAPEGGAPPMVMVQPRVAAGGWSWVTTDGTAWASTALVDAATAQATLGYTPQRISEGWLALVPDRGS